LLPYLMSRSAPICPSMCPGCAPRRAARNQAALRWQASVHTHREPQAVKSSREPAASAL